MTTCAVAGRWSVPSELLEAAERLGVEALLSSADRAGDLAEVEDELFRFGQVVAGDPGLNAVLADVTAPPAQRAELARALLEGKAKPATMRLVEVALAGFGGRSFTGALTRLVELAADRRAATGRSPTSPSPPPSVTTRSVGWAPSSPSYTVERSPSSRRWTRRSSAG